MTTTDAMSFHQACEQARAHAGRSGELHYVVSAGDGEYAVAAEDDLDTWWLGATVHATFDADGSRLD
jgi:hypothetical protein